MKKIKILTAVLLSLVITLSLCSCKVEMIDKGTTTTEEISTDDHDGQEGYEEFTVSDYEIKENAFEVSGQVNRYIYDSLENAGNVISTLNEYFDIELKVDESTDYENGYANWFYEDGSVEDQLDASVSASSKTGKFSFYFKPHNDVIQAASKLSEASEDELLEKATDFVNKFSFVTGELAFDFSTSDADLYYPLMNEEGTDSEDVRVPGRTFMFTSEKYSKQRLDLNETLNCYVECGNSNIKLRDVQYFTVTLLADGTIVSADNYITSAQILENGTYEMITEEKMDKIIEDYFRAPQENDKLVISRVFIDSYGNYFGYPEIDPVVKMEYYFESDPENVQVTEFAIEGFFN